MFIAGEKEINNEKKTSKEKAHSVDEAMD